MGEVINKPGIREKQMTRWTGARGFRWAEQTGRAGWDRRKRREGQAGGTGDERNGRDQRSAGEG